jgi:hypothetical protein
MKFLSLIQEPQKQTDIFNNQSLFSHYHICKFSVECLASSSTNTASVICLLSVTGITSTAFYRLRQE